MRKLFSDTRILDKLSREKYSLSEEIMMENAAAGLEKHLGFQSEGSPVTSELPARVIVLCGSGNNGADGYALARRIAGRAEVSVVAVSEPKSELCKLQAERAKLAGISFCDENEIKDADFIIDCIFGSGFHGDLDERTKNVISTVVERSFQKALKIACDVPTGLRADGTVADGAFSTDVTVTMGALKTCLYSDAAKDFVGEVFVEDLGISRELFENAGASTGAATGLVPAVGEPVEPVEVPEAFLLDETDFTPPHREKNNVNKGSFGHVAVFSGEKSGASVIAGLAALNFGAGLVTLISEKSFDAFPELMASEKIPEKTNVVVAGPGFGRENPEWKKIFEYLRSNKNVAAVLDADVFYREELVKFLNAAPTVKSCEAPATAPKIVLTPHPKEFQNLWKMCFGEELTVDEIVSNKINLAKKFAEKYTNVVLVLKGANVIIATSTGSVTETTCDGGASRALWKLRDGSTGSPTLVETPATVYICPLGTAALAKAGSGDVLSGLIASLLVQGRSPFDAAKNGVLAHALGSTKFQNNWELTPLKLIEKVDKMIGDGADTTVDCHRHD